jgi:hypothetical protein
MPRGRHVSNGSDRRQFWRAAFQSTVEVIAAAGNQPATLVDISLRGALVQVTPGGRVEIGDACQIRLNLADNASIIMHAVVAHIQGGRVGLRCECIDLDSMTHLRQLVALNAGDTRLLEREFAALLIDN